MSLLAKTKTARYAGICRKLEKKYKMSSRKFLEEFEAGKLGDDKEFFDWYAAARGLNLKIKQEEILSSGDFA